MSRDRSRVSRIDAISVVIAGVAFLIGIILAYLATPVDGLIVGLLTEITLETLNASYKDREYELRLGALSPVPRGPESVTKLADVGAFVQGSPHAEFLRGELQLRIAEFEAHLDHLVRGRVVRDGLDIQDLLRQSADCVRDLRATTTVRAAMVGSPDSWWKSRAGRDYWEANKAAISRGVAVTRVFVVDKITEEIMAFLTEQAEAGVEVYVVPDQSLPLNLRANVIVWDGVLAWRSQMDTTGQISENRLYTRLEDVRQLESVFLSCKLRAQPLAEIHELGLARGADKPAMNQPKVQDPEGGATLSTLPVLPRE